jgi:fatty-acyl-CoA synthase
MSNKKWNHTVAAAIRAGAAEQPDRTAFVFEVPGEEPRTYSYARLHQECLRRAAAMVAEGLRRGDRVAMIVPLPEDFVLTFLGATLAGIVPVPMYPPVALGKVESYTKNAEHIVSSSGARMLLTTKQVRPIVGSLLEQGTVEKLLTLESMNLDAPTAGVEADVRPDELCFLQYTSGSTSAPKGVMVTHGNLSANAFAIMRTGTESVDAKDDDVGVSWLPLYHDMGLIGFVIAPLMDRIPITFIPTMEFVKRPVYWLEMLTKYKATITFAPNFAWALAARKVRDADLPSYDLSRLRVAGCGAEPIQPATLRMFVERLKPAGMRYEALLPCYGMAEATLAMSFEPTVGDLKTDVVDLERFRQGEARPFDPSHEGARSVEVVACGRALKDHALAAFDESGQQLPDRMIGELAFRGPSVTPGYFNNPEATAKSFRDGWLFTGDLGYLVDGHVYICGRVKDMIIINGRNYYPTDIEWLVQEVDGVRKGAVIAFGVQPEGAASEQLVVVAEWAAKDRPTEEQLTAIKKRVMEVVQSQVGVNAWKVAMIPGGSIPKTSSGKLQRRRTKQQFEDGVLGAETASTDSLQAKTAVAKQVARSYVSMAKSEVMSRLPDPMRAIFGNKKKD